MELTYDLIIELVRTEASMKIGQLMGKLILIKEKKDYKINSYYFYKKYLKPPQ